MLMHVEMTSARHEIVTRGMIAERENIDPRVMKLGRAE
jgi:hypothetical protein